MGDGTEKKPYTRKDVLRLIKENGGRTVGLDLSGKWFEKNIDLRSLDLRGIILEGAVFKFTLPEPTTSEHAKLDEDELLREFTSGMGAHFEKANLSGAHLGKASLENAHLERASLIDVCLEEAVLTHAHLEKANLMYGNLEKAKLFGAHLEETNLSFADFEGAILVGTHLEGADLTEVNLEGTLLYGASLKGAYLSHVRLSSDTTLQHVDWGDRILGQERRGQFRWAEDTYRQLKTWYTEHGMYDTAAEFYYREMEARRKEQSWKWKPHLKLWSWVMRLLCGYGEKPERVGISAAVVVFGLALIYFAIGTLTPNTFLDSLYYSAVSFIALGYGQWAPEPAGWVKGLGVFEAFVGVFMMALFLVTFTRKMTR